MPIFEVAFTDVRCGTLRGVASKRQSFTRRRGDAFFDVEEREDVPMRHELLFRKECLSREDAKTRRSPNEALISACYEVSVGFAALSPPYTLCYEKAAHKGLDYGSVRRLFVVWGVPKGHEELLP